MSQIGTYTTSSSINAVQTLTGNSGGAVGPDGANNINVVGDGTVITVSGNPGTNTLTVTGDDAIPLSFPCNTGTAIPSGNQLQIRGGGVNTTTTAVGNIVLITLQNTLFIDEGMISSSNIARLILGTTVTTTQHPIAVEMQRADTPIGGFFYNTGSAGDSSQAGSEYRTLPAGGDAYTYYHIESVQNFSVGIDNSDSDTFKITTGSTPSLGNSVFESTSLGIISFPQYGSGALIADATGQLSSLNGTDGQLLIAATGSEPAFASVTSTGGTIDITQGANSLNLEVADGGFNWNVETTTSEDLVASNGYFANNAGTVTFTLPMTASVGDTFIVAGMNNATGWTIAQNAGQTIHFGSQDTMTGAGGSLSSTATYDVVELVCNIADTDFVVTRAVGNITVV